ncbi:hypothetical protein UFOVP236_69 [uncultured Caudovirales phage]|uniref:DUF932 domain-containing protein n=1 Tax=uncultured Caudovirales phage TaxID=2100421 RepID=A0A6J7WR06_9CAUD|nr:hypothetical protein UFOVP236_69 [uncultured Caudovirales phage]
MNAITTQETAAVTSAYKVDVSQGQLDGAVSSQWFNRPDDQRFLDLNSLASHVRARSDRAVQTIVDTKDIRVIASMNNPEKLALDYHGMEVEPTHWSFGQLSSLAGAPAGYLRKLPSAIAGINLQYGLANLRSENAKMYYDEKQLLAATGVEYGRVKDIELVEAVQRIAGNGNGDTRWKVPGAIDWTKGMYNPFVDPRLDTTTLYASDRDVFMFLVDDTHPIEIGKLKNGDPDLVFRGFYVWNSEVGSKTLGISTFMLRGVCQNRNIWGQQDKHSLTIRHSKNAPQRFAAEVGPALIEYSNQSDAGIITNVQLAKQAIVAKNEEDRLQFLGKSGFSAKQAKRIIETVMLEEDKPAESVWDFVQGITAMARTIKHTDDRLTMETAAGKLMSKVAH